MPRARRLPGGPLYPGLPGAGGPGVGPGFFNEQHEPGSTAGALTSMFYQSNRGLSPSVPPRPDPAAAAGPTAAYRLVQAGGILTQLLVHPAFVPFEMLFRKLPEEGMFTASAEANFQFELGAFQVPSQMSFIFVDYRFQIFRPSGAAVGDTVPLEAERLSTLIGYDVLISQRRKGNLRFEIDPVPIAATKDAFQPAPSPGVIASGSGGTNSGAFLGIAAIPQFAPSSGPTPPSQNEFDAANFVRSASPSGSALSTLPQRKERQGPLPMPFTYIVTENETVQLNVIVFKPIPIPIAFFEVDVTGFLFPSNVLEDMLASIKPSVSQGGGR